MSKCPFWSTSRENVECYKECPILASELEGQEGDMCIFHECTGNMNFRNIIKRDYNFLDLSIYDDDRNVNITY